MALLLKLDFNCSHIYPWNFQPCRKKISFIIPVKFRANYITKHLLKPLSSPSSVGCKTHLQSQGGRCSRCSCLQEVGNQEARGAFGPREPSVCCPWLCTRSPGELADKFPQSRSRLLELKSLSRLMICVLQTPGQSDGTRLFSIGELDFPLVRKRQAAGRILWLQLIQEHSTVYTHGCRRMSVYTHL